MVCSAQTSTMRRISGSLMPASVRSWRGEKQTTRQVPRVPSARNSPADTRASDVSGRSAAKSLVNTNVASYAGLAAPLTRTLPGHR